MVLEELVVCYSWNFGIFGDRSKDLNMMGKIARLWIVSSDAFSTIALTGFGYNVCQTVALTRFACIIFGVHQKNFNGQKQEQNLLFCVAAWLPFVCARRGEYLVMSDEYLR